ncbi:single-stranded-DNA-specific exonuclease RecJ [Treponema pedis]|uniref:single-stranded-DNA-specific exonuclease RecJ n=1 Tax=Treponema pedis TaxID=409322 RepID=UPI0004000354|nr:single-stranded-DNA-specific exonuclease RecJ [Treponema pedis]
MNWQKKEIGRELVNGIIKKYACDSLTAAILVRRGIIEGKDILFYLEDDMRYLYSPFLFKNMEDAVDRILDAKEEGEKVLIFGDRDVDGITSTTLLYEALKEWGMEVSWQIPTGDESYGLSVEAVEKHAANDGTLIITVDCGISNFKEIEAANKLGVDVIVVDHHQPQEKLPEAAVIINARVEGSGYPHGNLSGCATAWKLITAVRFGMQPFYKQQICFLNVVPVNEAYTIECIKLVNTVQTDKITETVIPGMLSFSETRLGSFLSGQQIFVWDAPLQKNQLKKIFGNGIEFNFFDFRTEAAKQFPQTAELSLLRLKEFSTIGKYSDEPQTEMDAFINIFITVLQHKNNFYGSRSSSEIQLVALSTLADLMELTGENRIIVRQGLKEMNKAPRFGLSDLFASQKLLGAPIGTEGIAWNISPLVNATGRMGRPETAIELFLAQTPQERTQKIQDILKMNEERKNLVASAWEQALPIARESLKDYNEKLAVAVSDKFYRGITGILSGKLAEYFNVPAIAMCLMPDGSAVASMRSARGIHLLDILEPYSEFFLDYGGHDFAAGFGIEQKKLPQFLEALKKFSCAMQFENEGEEESINIDAELPHEYLTPDILKLIDKFEPYGSGFPQLTFSAKKLKLINAVVIGKTEPLHLRLTLDCGRYKWTALYWKAEPKLNKEFKTGDYVDAVFRISRNVFNGAVTPQITLIDLKQSG